MPIFWHVRDPLLWWGYFLLGWLLRLHHATIRRWIVERRGLLVAGLAAAVVACTWVATAEVRTVSVRTAMWLDIHAILAFLFVATCGRRRAPAPVRFLADATYAIYLLHLFFIYALQLFVRPVWNEFDPLVVGAYWSAGLLGSLAVITLARALLGARSRDVIGA
jgi:peptidoglycan/LPS O-acetylase OafA/YrhL